MLKTPTNHSEPLNQNPPSAACLPASADLTSASSRQPETKKVAKKTQRNCNVTDGQTDVKPAPMIRWQGGKRRLAPHLLPLFPSHACYVELFAGGAALFFLRSDRAKVEVLNDTNGELVNLYRVVQHHFDEFVRQFDWTLGSREMFLRLLATPPEILTDIQRAARFFYLINNAFAGKVSGQTYGTATTRRAWSADGIADKLQTARRRLQGVYIEHDSWQCCLQRYDRPHTFFYADPPYWQTAGYGCAFGWEEYERLAEVMRTMQGKMMLSITDHPDIRALFAGFNTRELQTTYTIGAKAESRVPRRELVICNY